MSPPIFNPDGSEVNEIVLPDGSTASEVIGPDGNVVFEAGGDIPDSVLTQDLVAWYRFEDGDARDYASNAEFPNVTWGDSTAYDGTVNGATFQSSGGVNDFIVGNNSGNFRFLNGTSQNIQGPDITATQSNPFTAMCWCRQFSDFPADVVNNNSPICVRTGENTKWSLHHRQDDGNWQVFTESEGDIQISSPSGYSNGDWIHVAVIDDGNNLKLILNGGQNIGSDTGGTSFSKSETEPFRIGSTLNNSSGKDTWEGDIDDVRYYNTALSNSQVNQIYQNTEP